MKQEFYDEAIINYKNSLKIRFKIQGEIHPDVEKLYYNIGTFNIYYIYF